MSQEVRRPQADTGKIHSRNEFELCYLRHQYLRKTTVNPTKDEMAPFLPIAAHMAKNTFYTYKNLFSMVGFGVEDVIAIANVHLISFLGLFTLDKLPEKYDDFVNYHKNKGNARPTEEQFLNKNKANCTLFLKQRMEDVVRVCKQKARNIKGLPTEEYFYYCSSKKPPTVLKDLVDNYERLGFKKLDQAVYRSIRKRVLMTHRIEEGPVFRFNGVYYVSVPVDQKSLSLHDFSGAGMDPYDSLHNMTPEEVLFSIEDDVSFEQQKEKFENRSKTYRSRVLKRFIEQNRKDPKYKEELRAARKMLKNL